jgi:hypothetical protein
MNPKAPNSFIASILPAVLALLPLAGPARAATNAGPIKVFILAGQSNMEGQGVVSMDDPRDYNGGKGNLVWSMQHSKSADRMKHLRNDKGEWVVRDDVQISFKVGGSVRKGGLTVGFTQYGGSSHMGPELQFGNVMGDYFAEPVLLIKTAWGGKSLYVDFRPPSSGGQVGPCYTQMIAEVREALGELKGQAYELAGFVWQQGWNDMCTPAAIPEYAQNLVNLAQDIRREFNVPDLSVVVGELGNGGPVEKGTMFEFRKAQEEGARRIPNALFVKTSDFARPAEMSPNPSHGHHWFGNAESYFLIGDALGEGMKTLLQRGEPRSTAGNPSPAPAAGAAKPQRQLPLPGEFFEVAGCTAFVILPPPENLHTNRPTPWVWYAPTLPALPEARERWMFERFLAAGIAVAGVDVGESYGSPGGRAGFSSLYQELVERRGFSRRPCLLARSRGGLMLYNWAVEHPESVGAIAGIYPVCNLRSWPGLDKACGAYGLTAAQLDEQLARHNPIDRLAPLAQAGVAIFHIHGDADQVVPLPDNSAELARRYRGLGGSMRLRIAPGQGHNVWDGFFQCEELVEFVIAHASPAALREPSPALFRDPPMEARPGAFWDWFNGNVDLAEITRELREMKAKGMSGAEIWDIGVIAPNPDEPIPAGPAFLGPESIKAINHAIDEADRLGLHLGLAASSSWNAGGSWIQPRDAMKGLYHSEISVTGPIPFSQVLPFPATRAPKGTNGLPVYHEEVAVLAFQQTTNTVIRDTAAVTNLSGKMDHDGRLVWEVPAGTWAIARFITSNTGQGLTVPSPNSRGLLIDHLDAAAAETHFGYIVDQILKTRPSLDALRYMELDSVEVDNQTDWTGSFVDEFRKRRGYDPIPYLPALKGRTFSDPQIASRFQHDYRMTVSDLWIDGHYRASRRFLNTYGVQLVTEAGHGGYPRTDPLRSLGAGDVSRGEFWNGSRFWVVKEASSAAHIYGQPLVDAESFTGWRNWQDGPLEYKRLADTAFCDGLNRITFHTFAHTPPAGGVPGYAYHAGEHFNLNATWWNQSGPMLSYFSRCCYLLQQGLPVADVCFYYGDDAPNLVATRRIGPDSKRLDAATCAHCGRPNPAPADALGAGYDYDVVDSEVIQQRLELEDGRLMLPHGVNYSVIVLPERADIPLRVLEKLEKLVLAGATLLGPRPSREVTLADYPRCDEQVRTVAGRIWGTGDGGEKLDRRYGKGRVVSDRNRVREILQQQGVGPDFACASPGQPADLDYIHRRTLDSDIYFVSNTRMEDAEADCVFRVANRPAQLWLPDTGEIQSRPDAEAVAGGVKLRLHLPPAGSVFVVFGGAAKPTQPAATAWSPTRASESLEVAGPWEVQFPPDLGAPPARTFERLVPWTDIPDDGIKYFSGTATYLKEFDVPASLLDRGGRLELDLGQLRNIAEVTLNGTPLGLRWKPPFSYDVTGLVQPGRNKLAVKITNLWANRLAGDALLPRDKRITRVTQKLRFGGPLEAGLFGPVRLSLRIAGHGSGGASARQANAGHKRSTE